MIVTWRIALCCKYKSKENIKAYKSRTIIKYINNSTIISNLWLHKNETFLCNIINNKNEIGIKTNIILKLTKYNTIINTNA